jgi:hypothetical protein
MVSVTRRFAWRNVACLSHAGRTIGLRKGTRHNAVNLAQNDRLLDKRNGSVSERLRLSVRSARNHDYWYRGMKSAQLFQKDDGRFAADMECRRTQNGPRPPGCSRNSPAFPLLYIRRARNRIRIAAAPYRAPVPATPPTETSHSKWTPSSWTRSLRSWRTRFSLIWKRKWRKNKQLAQLLPNPQRDSTVGRV